MRDEAQTCGLKRVTFLAAGGMRGSDLENPEALRKEEPSGHKQPRQGRTGSPSVQTPSDRFYDHPHTQVVNWGWKGPSHALHPG